MLNSTEHKIYPANKCKNANTYRHDKYNIKQENSLFVGILVFMSIWNFVLSWVEHEKSLNL